MLDAHGEMPVTRFVIERHRHEAVGVLKDAVGPDSAIPAHRLMETLLGRLRSDDDQNTSPPISTLSYATALWRGNHAFPSRGVESMRGVELIKKRQEQALD